jgi:hypothetical protein
MTTYYAVITLSISETLTSLLSAFCSNLTRYEGWKMIYENDATSWSVKVEANNIEEAKEKLKTSLENALNGLRQGTIIKYALQISTEEHSIGSLRK